jgi:hypothetical protein
MMRVLPDITDSLQVLPRKNSFDESLELDFVVPSEVTQVDQYCLFVVLGKPRILELFDRFLYEGVFLINVIN